MQVDLIDLPDEGTEPIPLTQICGRAHELFSDVDRLMLEDPEVAKQRATTVRSYQDPVLQDRSQRLRLAARLWKAGMLVLLKTSFPCYTIIALKKVQQF